MPETKEIKRVPARYIGSNQIILAPGQGTGFNADGSRRDTRAISQGDILLLPEQEVKGYTQLREGDNLSDMGIGRRVKPEHAELDERELGLAGYEFHRPRADFEALSDEESAQEMKRLTDARNEALGLSKKKKSEAK